MIHAIQTGTATIAASSSSTTAAITKVLLNKAYCNITWRCTTTSPANGSVRCYFSSDSQLTFEVYSAVANPVTIFWQVVEFNSVHPITVQHFQLTSVTNGTTTTINSSPTANTYPIYTQYKSGVTFSEDDLLYPEITNSTTVTYRITGGTIDAINLEVISSPGISVQSGSILNTNLTTINTTITAITQIYSFAVTYQRIYSAGTNNFNNFYTSEFTSDTNLQQIKGNGSTSQNVYYYVISFITSYPVGWYTQWSYVQLTGTSSTISWTAFTVAKTYIHIGGSVFGAIGRQNTAGSDYNEAFHTGVITSSTLSTYKRNSSATNSVITSWVISDNEATDKNWFLLNMRNRLYNSGMQTTELRS